MKKLTLILLTLFMAFTPVVDAKTKTAPAETRKPVVVLPSEFSSHDVVVYDTPQYQLIIAKNAALKKQVETEKTNLVEYQKKTDEALRIKEQVAQETREKLATAEEKAKKHSFFSWLFGGTTILLTLGVIGLIILGIANPAIFVSIVTILFKVIKIVGRIFGATMQGVATLVTHLEAYQKQRADKAAADKAAQTPPPEPPKQ